MGPKITFLFLVLTLIAGCSVPRLKNTVDGMAFQCGAGYDPEKSYIKITDPSQNETRTRLIVLADKDISVTEKGCMERPADRLFVTNPDRSAGIWVAPDSDRNLKLETLGRVDLPAACNSVVHGNGAGFTLNFDLKENRNRELQSLEVKLYHPNGEVLSTWEPRPLESANYFAFHKDKPILSGDYRLVALVADRISTAQSKSECTLRLNDSNLYIAPADKIADKRQYNGQEVLIVQPGYNLNFYVQEGFRDVKIEYCLRPLSIDAIAPVMAASTFECLDPKDFLTTQSPTLNEGFWILNYRGQRGLVETAWQHAIFLVEKTCLGSFDSIATLKSLQCTFIRGDLDLRDLNDSNQHDLDSIGRIAGSLKIENTAAHTLDVLPNLNDVIGDIRIANNRELTEIRGFAELAFVVGTLSFSNDTLKKIDAFKNLQAISGSLSLYNQPNLLEIASFTQLQSIGGTLHLQGLNLKNLAFLSHLQTIKDLRLLELAEIKDLSGLTSLRTLQSADISDCALTTLEGVPALQTLESLTLSGLNISDLHGLGTVKAMKKILVDAVAPFSSFLNGTQRIQITESLTIAGENQLEDLSGLDFPTELNTVELSSNNLTIKGLENVKKISKLQLDNLQSLKTFKGLNAIEEIGTFTVNDSPLADFSALVKLKSLQNLRLSQLPLTDFKTLPQGLVVQGEVDLRRLDHLTSLEGLNHLAAIGGNLLLFSQPHLKTLKGLEGLTIKGSVEIGYNSSFDDWDDGFPELTDIMPLTQVSRIGGSLHFNSPICLPAGFQTTLSSKVSGSEDPSITIRQPETCS